MFSCTFGKQILPPLPDRNPPPLKKELRKGRKDRERSRRKARKAQHMCRKLKSQFRYATFFSDFVAIFTMLMNVNELQLQRRLIKLRTLPLDIWLFPRIDFVTAFILMNGFGKDGFYI